MERKDKRKGSERVMSETCLGTIDRINMKRSFHAILFVFLLTLLTSFSHSLPRRFESFVENLEDNCRRNCEEIQQEDTGPAERVRQRI